MFTLITCDIKPSYIPTKRCASSLPLAQFSQRLCLNGLSTLSTLTSTSYRLPVALISVAHVRYLLLFDRAQDVLIADCSRSWIPDITCACRRYVIDSRDIIHSSYGCTGLFSHDVCAFLEIQAKTLGMKVEIFDPEGKNIEDTGLPGELVCTRPHPSLPLGFWGDESGEKFRKAYFDTYPGTCGMHFYYRMH